MPNKTVLKQKEESVKALAESLKDAKAIILVEYSGLTAAQSTQIRADLRTKNSEYKVAKNNITRRALEANGIKELDEYLNGPVAIAIGKEDYLGPAKVLYNFSKDNSFYKIKAGIIDGKLVTAEEIITLAKLPSREELIAKLAGCLLANVSKLAVALDQVRVQKEGQTA